METDSPNPDALFGMDANVVRITNLSPRLSVVIPVHNGGDAFQRCLEAIASSSRLPDEWIVVEDGSTDGSGQQAERFGAHVLPLSGPAVGPAKARNAGAAAATGDVIIFLDADVVVHPDTLSQIASEFEQHSEIAALFGSYDDVPPASGYVSQYKNLLHHYTHQHGRREASTFWAGCGAIRRHVFEAIGGFSEVYSRPAVEDIELGMRLCEAGYRIALCPEIRCTHLKRWTLPNLLKTDIFQRAVPWSQLLARQRHLPNDLNLDVRSRLSAMLLWTALLLAPALFRSPCAGLGVGLIFAGFISLHRSFFGLLIRRGGAGLALAGFGLHSLYFLYSSLIFTLILLGNRRFLPRRTRAGRR